MKPVTTRVGTGDPGSPRSSLRSDRSRRPRTSISRGVCSLPATKMGVFGVNSNLQRKPLPALSGKSGRSTVRAAGVKAVSPAQRSDAP